MAYQPIFDGPKILYPVISQGRKFSFDSAGLYLNDKCFIARGDFALLAYLNSQAFWFWIFGESSALRGGHWRLELREQYISLTPLPEAILGLDSPLTNLGSSVTEIAQRRLKSQNAFLARLADLNPSHAKPSRKLENFHELDFSELRAEIKRVFKAEIPLKERGEWETFHAEAKAEVLRLNAQIAEAEREIDALVYEAFGLTDEEIKLLEASIAGQA